MQTRRALRLIVVLLLAAVSMVAGIGFTVSLFITGLAYTDAARIDDAKLGVLVGSALIGVCGYVLLRFLSSTPVDAAADSPFVDGLIDAIMDRTMDPSGAVDRVLGRAGLG